MVEVIFEDNHLLVVNKPGGLLTQPSGTEQDSLEARAKLWLKQKYAKPGNVFLEAVHRLDKPVSGIVLFAKTSKALSRLNAAMRDKRSKKCYLAHVEGNVIAEEGVLEHYLAHDEYQARVVKESEGKLARLSYRVKERFPEKTVLEVVLDTGRYHQIRVQLAAVGHPIVGDKRYGSKMEWKEGQIALCHYCLEIPHPVRGDWLKFSVPVP